MDRKRLLKAIAIWLTFVGIIAGSIAFPKPAAIIAGGTIILALNIMFIAMIYGVVLGENTPYDELNDHHR